MDVRSFLVCALLVSSLEACNHPGIALRHFTDSSHRIQALEGVDFICQQASFRHRVGKTEISGKPVSPEKANEVVDFLRREILLYPRALLTKTRTSELYLCTELRCDDERRPAVPNFITGAMYIDVSEITPDWMYAARAFHHEYYHLVDFCDDGQLTDDIEWAALNRTEFHYGHGTITGQDQYTLHPTPGFLNEYGKVAVEEDKAELFSMMVVLLPIVQVYVLVDPILNRKVELLKTKLKHFCPVMTESVWTTVREMRLKCQWK